jgi:DNA-binding MarR family transcriptional regulator
MSRANTVRAAVGSDALPAPPLGYLLVDAVRLMRRDFRARTAGLRLTPALARLLFYVNRAPGARQVALAAYLEVTPVTLGRMIDRLVARGYVRRRADAADRRAVRVYVARAGEPLIARMNEVGALITARALRGLSRAERTQLLRLLARLCANLGGGGQ